MQYKEIKTQIQMNKNVYIVVVYCYTTNCHKYRA